MYNYQTAQGHTQIPTTSLNTLGMTHNPYIAQNAMNTFPVLSQVAAGFNAIGAQGINSIDAVQMLMRIEAQLVLLTATLQGRTLAGVQPTTEMNPIRLRESDSHIYCELFLANLTVGDVEVEVNGNRIICRTLVPFMQINRWYSVTALPRGFEFFELPDGRVEFSWVSPVSFIAKDIEPAFREGFLCIAIPKTVVATTTTHKVKVAKDASARVQ